MVKNDRFLNLSPLLLFVWLLCWASPTASFGQTFAERTLQQQGDLILPQRVTVGLNDHFQSVLLNDGETLIHSGSSNLAVRLYRQNLKQGFSVPLIDEKFDSKDPALSPSGRRLAFTGYGRDARGDICLYEFSSRKVRCLTDRKSEDRQPFWLSEDELGFLSRSDLGIEFSIVTLRLNDPMREVLVSGRISDPTASKDGRWIAYTRLTEGRSQIEILDRGTKKAYTFVADLPGFTSFHQFDEETKYLYFAQYTSDTNDDFQIDGRDQSAIFRVLVSSILNQEPARVEPLTSIRMNCNYPAPTREKLFMTCTTPTITGDGVLDIYQLPLTGMIPREWIRDYVLRAIQTARSYSDRNLLHQYLMASDPSYATSKTFENLLSNSIMDEQWVAGIYYAQKLFQITKDSRYETLEILLSALSARARRGENPLSAAAREGLQRLQKRLSGLKGADAMKNLASAGLAYALDQSGLARSQLQKVSSSSLGDLISLHLHAFLSDRLSLGERLSRLKNLSTNSKLNATSRAFYAYEFLKAADREKRGLSFLENLSLPKSSTLAQLIEVEILVSKISSDDVRDKANQTAYAELTKRLNELKNDYSVMRAALARSVLQLSKRKLWTYMGFVSSRWLNWLPKEDPEFGYARRQFLQLSLERAYGRYAEQKYSRAGDQFYNTLPATDDLEAHHGFIRSRLKEKKSAELKAAYEGLQKQNAIDENLLYARGLQNLLEAESAGEVSKALYEDLLKSLEAMSNRGFNQAPRLALMGYAAHHLFMITKERALFEKANRYFMLALDLSTQNERLASALLMNLGRLHQQAENHGQSLTFFELRRRFAFENPEEEEAFQWMIAKAYSFNRSPQQSFQTIMSALSKNEVPEFRERAAFYALQAEDFSSAVQNYERYLRAVGERAKISTRLGYAYALFKSKNSKAKSAFEKVLAESKSTTLDAAFPPEHFRQLSLGYLAQLESRPEKRLEHLEARERVLESIKGDLNSHCMKAEDWTRNLLKIEHQKAEVLLRLKRAEEARKILSASLPRVQALRTQTKNPLDRDLVQAIANLDASGMKDEKLLSLREEVRQAMESVPELKSVKPYSQIR